MSRGDVLAKLAAFGVDLDAPISLGSVTTIRDADDTHLARRLAMFEDDAEHVANETLRAETISIATAVSLMRKQGLQGGSHTLDTAIAQGALEAVLVDGAARVTPAALARYLSAREASTPCR